MPETADDDTWTALLTADADAQKSGVAQEAAKQTSKVISHQMSVDEARMILQVQSLVHSALAGKPMTRLKHGLVMWPIPFAGWP